MAGAVRGGRRSAAPTAVASRPPHNAERSDPPGRNAFMAAREFSRWADDRYPAYGGDGYPAELTNCLANRLTSEGLGCMREMIASSRGFGGQFANAHAMVLGADSIDDTAVLGPGGHAGCWAAGCRRRRRWERFCGRLRSGMSASSTRCWAARWAVNGKRTGASRASASASRCAASAPHRLLRLALGLALDLLPRRLRVDQREYRKQGR